MAFLHAKTHPILLLASTVFAVASCGGKGVDYGTMDFASLVAKTHTEGTITSVGMPDDWANWGATWSDLKLFYDFDHTDTDMNSADILDCFLGKGVVSDPDIGDVGLEYAKEARSKGLLAGYKSSYWDEIPAWAKDETGEYAASFTGTMAFLIDPTVVGETPTSFADLRKGTYKIAISNVATGSTGQFSVYAAALAMGGSADNIAPGIQFFKSLAQEGRLVEDLGYSDFMKDSYGKVGVQLKWDFKALSTRDRAESDTTLGPRQLTALIPTDASVTAGYSTIINKDAKNLYSAMLIREYILSDAGQLNIARGYATPIRSVKIPNEIASRRIDRTQYSNSQKYIEDGAKFSVTLSNRIATAWTNDVETLVRGSSSNA